MPRNLYQVGRIWYARLEKNGRTIRRSLETDRLAVAQERLAVLRREVTGAKWGEQPARTFDDAARRFKDEHFGHLEPTSRKRYVVSLIALADTFHRIPLSQIGSAMLGDYERARLAAGVTSATVRRDLACLSSMFTRAEEWEWVTSNPVRPYLRGRKSYLRESEPRTRYLTHAEEAGVIATAPPKAAEAIAFAIDTGLRKAEQFGLIEGDVSLQRNEILVRAEIAKGGKARVVPLLPRVRAWIEARPPALPHLPLFRTNEGKAYSAESPTMYEALQKACRRASIGDHVRWHDLRRTCGCRLLQDLEMSFEEVAAWLGHADVKITQQRYAFLHVNQLHKALARGGRVVPFARREQS